MKNCGKQRQPRPLAHLISIVLMPPFISTFISTSSPTPAFPPCIVFLLNTDNTFAKKKNPAPLKMLFTHTHLHIHLQCFKQLTHSTPRARHIEPLDHSNAPWSHVISIYQTHFVFWKGRKREKRNIKLNIMIFRAGQAETKYNYITHYVLSIFP